MFHCYVCLNSAFSCFILFSKLDFCYGVPSIVSIFSHSCLYHSSFVLAPTFIFVILIFSVVKKLNEFSFFLDLGFFGLQLI